MATTASTKKSTSSSSSSIGSYKGVSIIGGSDASVASQIKAIDAKSTPTTSSKSSSSAKSTTSKPTATSSSKTGTTTSSTKKPTTTVSSTTAKKDYDNIQSEFNRVTGDLRNRVTNGSNIAANGSVVDLMKSQGFGDTSFAGRQKLAKQFGMKDYAGTAEQNKSLYDLVAQKTYDKNKTQEQLDALTTPAGPTVQSGASTQAEAPDVSAPEYTTTPSGQQISSVPQTQADIYAQDKIDLVNEADKTWSSIEKSLKKIENGTFPLSSDEKSMIDALNKTVESSRQKQIDLNNQYGRALETSMARGGGEYYDQITREGILHNNFAIGEQQIADIELEGLKAVNELKQAFKEQRYTYAKDRWTEYKALMQEKKDVIQDLLDEARDFEKTQAANQIKTQSEINSVLQTAIKAKAPIQVIDAIRSSRTTSEALTNAGDYLTTEDERLDMAYKRAQIAKIYDDMATSGSGGTSDPALLIAYAQQYASTGKIPTGIPKGSFGTIAAVAKEMPKLPGELVDAKTGVKPDVGAEMEKGFASLYSAIDLSKQLAELDKQRMDGFISGSLGKVFGSEDQQRYIDLREQIVDLLSRARSGAALTVNEEKRFSDMLPGRLSEPFGIGVDSDVRITNFTNALTDDLVNKTSSLGVKVNGISPVELGGQEYIVGDIIENELGQFGRINADGTITLLQ